VLEQKSSVMATMCDMPDIAGQRCRFARGIADFP
jgi:hypothetical protein